MNSMVWCNALAPLAKSLGENNPSGVEDFFQSNYKISQTFIENVKKCTTGRQRSNRVTQYVVSMTQMSSSQDFITSIASLFQTTVGNITPLQNRFGATFLHNMRKVTLHKVAQTFQGLPQQQTPLLNSDHMTTPHGRGKLRYLVGRTLHKTKVCTSSQLTRSLYSAAQGKIKYLKDKLELIDHLTATEEDLQVSCSDPDSLVLTQSRQNLSRGLTNVSDQCYLFFLYVDHKRLTFECSLSREQYNCETPREITNILLCDVLIKQKWNTLFDLQTHVTDELFDILMDRFLLVANNQLRKSLLLELKKKKTKAHRTQIMLKR